MTNPTPLDRAENGHIWHARVFASMQIKCCMNCGFIKNEKQPNKPCPGPIGVETRAVAPDLDRAIREAVEARWLPIESAPKDGEPVLIWKPDERRVGEYMMAAYWDDDKKGFVPVGGIHKQGYYSDWAGCDQGYPTHWMPLPAPPVAIRKDQP